MHLTPRLIVDDAARAVEWYHKVFGAQEIDRFIDPAGVVVHSELRIGQSAVTLTEASPELAATVLGGSPVLLTIEVDDAIAVGDAMVADGASVVIPIEDRFYGARQGRLRDPFGHLWIVSTTDPTVTSDEVRERLSGEAG